MEFRVYDVPTGGTPLWEELWTGGNAVSVSDGLFNVMLGSLNTGLANVVQTRDELYLGITVGTDSEMTPRVQLGSVPFSMHALNVPDDTITSNKVLDGSIDTVDMVSGSVTDVYFVSSADAMNLQPDDQWHDDVALSISDSFDGGNILINLTSPGTWCDTEKSAIDVRILIDGVAVTKARTSFQHSMGYAERQTDLVWSQSITPGSHTITVQWKAGVEINQAMIGMASRRALTVLELKR
jgi:hypothetical protein